MPFIIGQVGSSFILAVGIHAGAQANVPHQVKERDQLQAVQVMNTVKLQTYQIQTGDSLSQVAFDYGTTVDHLKALNHLKDDTIISGQMLSIDTKRIHEMKPAQVTAVKQIQVQSQPQPPVSMPQGHWVTMTVTAYTPSGGAGDGSVTASGTSPTEGRTIAMGPSYPFGTKVMINGHVYTVEDRGGAIDNSHIDLFMNSEQAAISFGRQTLKVLILP